uniref:Uncharacterized protein n=1 Tax=Anguilla anguilla TaxID=7936 RepID=A0A0E9TSS0_ANGAN
MLQNQSKQCAPRTCHFTSRRVKSDCWATTLQST